MIPPIHPRLHVIPGADHQQSIRELQVPAYIVDSLDEADLVMTL